MRMTYKDKYGKPTVAYEIYNEAGVMVSVTADKIAAELMVHGANSAHAPTAALFAGGQPKLMRNEHPGRNGWKIKEVKP